MKTVCVVIRESPRTLEAQVTCAVDRDTSLIIRHPPLIPYRRHIVKWPVG